MASKTCTQIKHLLGQDVVNMNKVQGFMGVTGVGYVCQNSMIKRLSLPTLDVLRELNAREVFLVLLEKPADKDRKPKFSNQPKNRSDNSSLKNTQ